MNDDQLDRLERTMFIAMIIIGTLATFNFTHLIWTGAT